MVRRYRAKISGPLLDRIDLHVEVPPVSCPELLEAGEAESSAEVAKRVDEARRRQRKRFERDPGLYANAHMGARAVRKFCETEETGLSMLRTAMARFGLSARSFHRVLKIARTIADLDASDIVRASHVAEAIQYRGLDRRISDGVTASP